MNPLKNLHELHLPLPHHVMMSSVIVVNGRMYRSAGRDVTDPETGIRKTEFVQEGAGRPTFGRGRSKHFRVDLNTNELRLQDAIDGDAPKSFVDAVFGLDVEYESYRDLITIPSFANVMNGSPRFKARRAHGDKLSLDTVQSLLTSRRVSTYIIDGYLVSVNTATAEHTTMIHERIPGIADPIIALSMNPLNALPDDEPVLVAGWDGYLREVGTNVYATTDETADKLREVLDVGVVTRGDTDVAKRREARRARDEADREKRRHRKMDTAEKLWGACLKNGVDSKTAVAIILDMYDIDLSDRL